MATDVVAEAMGTLNRKDFVPAYLAHRANDDVALPIGFGQTISQPTTVRMMLRWLEAKSGDKILDIGSGSGWTTALLSTLTGPRGRVIAVERIPELLEYGKNNCRKVGTRNAKFYLAGAHYGFPRLAPYKRILVSAAARQLPQEILDQLAVGGKLVIPVNNDILVVTRLAENRFATEKYEGFVFVPLIEKA